MTISPRLVGALVAVVAGAGVVAVIAEGDDDHPSEWDPRVADLVAFVEDERGHDFDHPVAVDFLTEKEYAELTRTDAAGLTDEEQAEIEDTEGLLRALGLVEGDLDLVESINDLSDTGTLAYYDFEEDRIVVRGTEVTPDLAVTLVHELTHALQDQVFDLGRLAEDGDDTTSGEQFAFRALAEGDADRVETSYVESLGAHERTALESVREEGLEELEAEEIPDALTAIFAAPYALGSGFVLLLDAVDDDALDEAFADPPTTEEHLLDPFTFLDGDDPAVVDAPEVPDGADVFDEGDFGALSLFLVLAARVDVDLALDAALGWGGDSYAAYRRDGGVCMAFAVVGDEPADTDELELALEAWAGAAPDASATTSRDGDVVRLESCDPGADAAVPSGAALDALQIAAIRSQILAEWTAGGAPRAAAECFADEVLDDFEIEELTSEELPADFDQRLQQAALGCA